ncbi:macrophage activating glycoprotein [Coprinopsis sp. MPI-PUGE-AT-0042]|nr:macrophage activating glycoprotein [Coprinopsis sp. MPI-PUGE-AT-0042]
MIWAGRPTGTRQPCHMCRLLRQGGWLRPFVSDLVVSEPKSSRKDPAPIKTMLATISAIAIVLAGISTVHAQTPEFQGELLLQPQPNNGEANQKWVFTGGGVRVFGNKCLDVTEGVEPGWNLNSKSGRALRRAVSISPGTITSGTTTCLGPGRGKCVDLTDGNQADGNRIQIWGCSNKNPNQVWSTGYRPNALPDKSQNDQFGTNICGTASSQSSNCQTAWINSATDFCLYAPRVFGTVGDNEREAVAWCTKSGRGTRTIPNGTLQGVHFVRTPEYVQITGVGDFTKINIPAGDGGGELDNKGADWKGSKELCNHIYDLMGCWWANYAAGVYEECQGNPATPMGVYGTSTWFQGVSPTPAAHPAPASSGCTTISTVGISPLRRSLPKARAPVIDGRELCGPRYPSRYFCLIAQLETFVTGYRLTDWSGHWKLDTLSTDLTL